MASNVTTEDWKERIKAKLIALYEKKDQGDLAKIIWYLGKEDEKYMDSTETSIVWKILRTAQQSSDEFFERYVVGVADKAKRADNGVPLRATMDSVYKEMMEQSKESVPEEFQQRFERLRKAEAIDVLMIAGLAVALGIPMDGQVKIPELMSNNGVLVRCLNGVNGSGRVGMASIYLYYEAIENIALWWREELIGRRCAKNIVDWMFATEPLGSFIGPVGIIDSTSIGGVVSAQVVNALIDRATQTLFGLPKEEALENAYRFFGVKMSASNSEVNSAFRQLCHKHHPDKGGNKEEFFFLQLNMGVIKQRRQKRGLCLIS